MGGATQIARSNSMYSSKRPPHHSFDKPRAGGETAVGGPEAPVRVKSTHGTIRGEVLAFRARRDDRRGGRVDAKGRKIRLRITREGRKGVKESWFTVDNGWAERTVKKEVLLADYCELNKKEKKRGKTCGAKQASRRGRSHQTRTLTSGKTKGSFVAFPMVQLFNSHEREEPHGEDGDPW